MKNGTKAHSKSTQKPARRPYRITFGRAERTDVFKNPTPAAPARPAKPGSDRKRSSRGQTAATPNGEQSQQVIAPITTQAGVDLREKVKELLALAKEQGYLTYDDIDDVLAESQLSPDDLDTIYTRLGSLEIEIVDQAEVESPSRQPDLEEEDEKSRLDSLDDPVRMYMRQMGKVPLLTREQEVSICKRIEEAELQLKQVIYSFGFTAKEHIALAEKLISEPPKERFDRVIIDKKLEVREGHLKELRHLVKSVRQLDRQIASQFYERTGISKNKAAMLGRGSKSRPGDAVSADDEVRDPLVLEFLGLKDEYSESDLEEALVRHVEAFLLELGGDFAFIGRQRRLRIGDEWYRIDLLFFHRGLRCLIVIDLKVGKFTHADRWYGQGLFVREARLGTDMGASRVYSAQPGDFVCNRLLAWEDSFAVAGTESLGALPGAGHRPRTPAPSP